MSKIPVTQRAYTLRLSGTDKQDKVWRDALWKTHEAVNKGAKVFGDWLLTLRGGLSHELADARIPQGKGKPDREPTDDERRGRRILLALSWLSVESRVGAPEDLIIATGEEVADDRNKKVLGALSDILNSRGLAKNEAEEWKKDCEASLSATIRKDAVWVNRSKAFDEAAKLKGCSLDRDEVWDMLERFFGSRETYLAPAKNSDDDSSASSSGDKAKDLVQKAGQWLSSRFGTGKGADFSRMVSVYEKIAEWAGKAQTGIAGENALLDLAASLGEFNPVTKDLRGILALVSGPGYKSATRNLLSQIGSKVSIGDEDLEKIKEKAAEDVQKCIENSGSKGQRPYSNIILKDVESICGFVYRVNEDGEDVSVADYSQYPDDHKWGSARHSEFAVILDHAARRVSLAHTWIKLAESERHKFEEDARRMDNVPSLVKEWLDAFCRERSDISGSLDPYRIRRRAVDGWKEIVAAWSKSSCVSNEDRIAAARALQDNLEIEKFGDIQLFEALAEDDASCVWHKDGDTTKSPDPQALIDYVSATEAEFKKRHFKVPAYRHPDELLHPIFCDFGNSRWDISFEVHKNPETDNPHALSMVLWTGNEVGPVPLRWQSKKLVHDLALGQDVKGDNVFEITRADRLGRAASNVTGKSKVKIAGLFEQTDWNGRLQAPRRQLEDIAAIRDNSLLSGGERTKRIEKLKTNMNWLVTFSAKLQPQGPWCEFAEKLGLKIDPQYWPHSIENKIRKGNARLILSRLPGLRVLSVDLGHRFAAACAVWETINNEGIKEICKAAGCKYPGEEDLYLHIKNKVKKQKNGKDVDIDETTICRRIGADTIDVVDEKTGEIVTFPHPAPWARLDRQFLIKLQGEEEGVREASNEEIWAVHQLEVSLGRSLPFIDRLLKSGWGNTEKQKKRLDVLRSFGWVPKSSIQETNEMYEGGIRRPSLAVDDLMSSTLHTMRLALKRHGDGARIAFAMTADYKPIPGDRRYYFTEARDGSANDAADTRHAKHVEFIQDALALWHGLAYSRGWENGVAKQLWNDHIVKLSGYNAPEEISSESSGAEYKKKQKENRDKLHGVAEALLEDKGLRILLHEAWKECWASDDIQWKKHLRWFKDWILPSGKSANNSSIRKVGGLSLNRLATLTEFRRKVQVGFFTRLQPNGERAETKEQFGQSTLDALEHLREQRVKQLASRIVEAALGVGRMKRSNVKKDLKRPRNRVDQPCHAVVIENLTHYRPEETRTRRENRQLMTWSSSKVKKYLAEACQLNGLHLREVQASYTSRQDSRTGVPGIRCQDVPINEFMQSPFWKKQVAQAERKLSEGKGDARERLLCSLSTQWNGKSEGEWKKSGIVRIPLKGGEMFVSADHDSPAAKGLQADLNAAANIGLKALSDPDWPGRWWYVPCEAGSYKPAKDKCGGSMCINLNEALKNVTDSNGDVPKKKRGGRGKTKSNKEVINLWADPSSQPISQDRNWQEFSHYWNGVLSRVVDVLNKSSGKGKSKEPLDAVPW